VRVGFLYPGHAAEDDYPLMATRLDPPVDVVVEHTSVGTDAHEIDALLDLGDAERLAPAADRLKAAGVDAAVWACTSGSFVFGPEGAGAQVRALQDRLGCPASSTSFAFVHALEHLAIRNVAIAATYPRDVTDAFTAFLTAFGIEVTAVAAADVLTAAEVGTFGRDEIARVVPADRVGGGDAVADAALVPDTALHTAAWVDELEAELGTTVLTANQVTLWEALRLAGWQGRASALGRLFRSA
jgi:maleate cis-trans isomerase